MVFPSLNIKRALPLNQPVVIELPVVNSGRIAFARGMTMLHGTVVVSNDPLMNVRSPLVAVTLKAGATLRARWSHTLSV